MGPPPHRRPAGSSSAYQPELPQVSASVILTLVPAQHFMEFDFMATKTGAAKPEPVGTAMLEQLADLDAKSISPETARKFLDLAFSRLQQERVHALSQKAREGSLTPTEGAELDEFIRVANLLAILQSRARERSSTPAFRHKPMRLPAKLDRRVRERAKGVCEYCHLSQVVYPLKRDKDRAGPGGSGAIGPRSRCRHPAPRSGSASAAGAGITSCIPGRSRRAARG